ncbi:hypothetical protein GUJ93_ZPchr0012g20148 [Zizania palustris]|uniref:Uncharacterized protein n=1 Tax=Zizania palustris TaxID=103762 RepID=A0A8J5WUC4_ZIZPA|nr:hypothetical protein GUJ93_ZPchr0012g20148 [Zizania palustris]
MGVGSGPWAQPCQGEVADSELWKEEEEAEERAGSCEELAGLGLGGTLAVQGAALRTMRTRRDAKTGNVLFTGPSNRGRGVGDSAGVFWRVWSAKLAWLPS